MGAPLAILVAVLAASSPATSAPEGDAPPEERASGALPLTAGDRWRVSIGTAGLTLVELVSGLGTAFATALAGDHVEWRDRSNLLLRVDRDHGRVRLGATYARLRWKTDSYDSSGRLDGTATDAADTVLAHAFVRLVDRRHFELYTGAGLGVCRWSERWAWRSGGQPQQDSIWLYAFQAHVLGVGFGTEDLRGFLELGVGFEGLGTAGIAGRF